MDALLRFAGVAVAAEAAALRERKATLLGLARTELQDNLGSALRALAAALPGSSAKLEREAVALLDHLDGPSGRPGCVVFVCGARYTVLLSLFA